nr:integrase, catalytic region, zinc finger, CCHC-type, peptidase aspartic, catalytic [Tanacetum cinerariifolium]
MFIANIHSFQSKSKENEDKYMENEIDLKKKIKKLDNILFKVGQSAQTVHMLTKPQAFYVNIHKQALGHQNSFHLKKAQWNKPILYDGIVMSDKHVAMPVIDNEETLILKEESRSRIKPSDALIVKIIAPKKLPKISLVNESLKKLKFHLAKFDNVVKMRTTPNARTEEIKRNESCDKCFNLDAELLNSQNAHNNLLKRHSQLEKHCNSLEASIQLNQEKFQQDGSCDNQNALEILEFFKNNDLKAQLQDKDTTIYSGCSKHMTGNHSQLMNFVSKFLCTIRFGNDHIARIMGYGDYQLGNVTISRVYYVEGLGHNLFSVGQFCDANLEVEFWKNTCFIRNLEGVDLIFGSRDTNLYTNSLNDMLKTSLICLLSKASKTKSWLWHPRLSHLNFSTLNKDEYDESNAFALERFNTTAGNHVKEILLKLNLRDHMSILMD